MKMVAWMLPILLVLSGATAGLATQTETYELTGWAKTLEEESQDPEYVLQAHLNAWSARHNVPLDAPDTPQGIRHMQHIANLMMQPDPTEQDQPDPEAERNQTVLGRTGVGTSTHTHGNVGDQGFNPVWGAPFLGRPTSQASGDVNGDGVVDMIIGTELAVLAVNGVDQTYLWAHHIGSTVSDIDIQNGLVAYATYWEGQTPRVVRVDGATGDIHWTHVGTHSFIGLSFASEEGGDLLAADVYGNMMRLGESDGDVVWEMNAEVLDFSDIPDVASGLIYHDGHYLFGAGDLNGDGINDVVTASFTVLPLQLFTTVHAVSGSDGTRLWTQLIGGDPAVIHQAVLHDLDVLDAEGDGNADVSMTGEELRFYSPLVVPVYIWEADGFVLVVDGDSNTAGQPVFIRKIPLVSKLLPVQLEGFYDIDHLDRNNDNIDEVVVVRSLLPDYNDLVRDLSNDLIPSHTLETYTMPAGAGGDPTGLLLTPWEFPIYTDRMPSLFIGEDDAGVRHPMLAWLEPASGTYLARAATFGTDGTATPLAIDEQAPVWILAKTAGVQLVADERRLTFTSGSDSVQLALRGTPLAMATADLDGDSISDVIVASSDRRLHIIDGLNGLVMDDIELPGTPVDLRIGRLEGDWIATVFVHVEGEFGYSPYMVGVNLDSGMVRWQEGINFWFSFSEEAVWADFNGDGSDDFVSEIDYDSMTVNDGRTGATIWTNGGDSSTGQPLYWYDSHAAAVSLSADSFSDDLVLFDSAQAIAVNGETGGIRWEVNNLGSHNQPVGCSSAVDTDGDGTETLATILRATGRANSITTFNAAGLGPAWPLGADMSPIGQEVLLTCSIHSMAQDGFGSAQDLLVSLTYYDPSTDGARWLYGRYDVEAMDWEWKRSQQRPTNHAEAGVLTVDSAGQDGGNVYLWIEDHVNIHGWADGEHRAEFTVNGPFVRDAMLVEMDGLAPREMIIHTTDGLTWSLAENADVVRDRMHRLADVFEKSYGNLLGEPPAPDAIIDGAVNNEPVETPVGALLPFAALALAALAFRRRNNA